MSRSSISLLSVVALMAIGAFMAMPLDAALVAASIEYAPLMMLAAFATVAIATAVYFGGLTRTTVLKVVQTLMTTRFRSYRERYVATA